MMDPYKVLELSQFASDEEIKKAYRKLSRNYHPDSNANNPFAAQAEEKFKEVQFAYKEILEERSNSDYNRNNVSNESMDWSSALREEAKRQKDVTLKAAVKFINKRYYKEALNVLNDTKERTGQWYYLCALAHSGLGNNLEAMKRAKEAVRIEPKNRTFEEFLNRLKYGRERYQKKSEGYVKKSGNFFERICC